MIYKFNNNQVLIFRVLKIKGIPNKVTLIKMFDTGRFGAFIDDFNHAIGFGNSVKDTINSLISSYKAAKRVKRKLKKLGALDVHNRT
jgi:hypothetical protein